MNNDIQERNTYTIVKERDLLRFTTAGYLAEEIIVQTGAQFTVDHISQIRNTMSTQGLLS